MFDLARLRRHGPPAALASDPLRATPAESPHVDPLAGSPAVQREAPKDAWCNSLGASDTGLQPGTRLGDFTLLARLGRGSQGEVFSARQESLGRLVAVKVLPAHLMFGQAAVQRFQREAAAGGRLQHPGIVGVHAIGEHDGVHFIAQELVPEGRHLGHVLEEARAGAELPRDWSRRMARLFLEVAEALHAAHGAGVVHRDVKPGNILITPEGQPKLADFGLALLEDELRLSRSGELTGTPYYMSPEQVIGARATIDRRTDVFSLGTTFYEALTLNRPFQGDTRDRVLDQIRLHDPPDPRSLRPGLPRDLAVICCKALHKRPQWRYATAGAMADDLRRWLAGDAIVARPPSLIVRAVKWTARHPVATAAGSVSALALVIVMWLLLETRAANIEISAANIEISAANIEIKRSQAETKVALEATQRQHEAAVIEGKNAEASLRVLETMIRRFAPSSPESDPVVFRELLDSGAEQLSSLDNQPDAQLHLLLVLGSYYRDLAAYPEAEPLLERAAAITQARFAENDGRTLRSLFELARLRRLTGDLAGAHELNQRVLALCPMATVDDGPDELEVTAELGRLAMEAGRWVEAEALLRAYLRGCLESPRFGADHAESITAHHMLGQLLLEQGRLDEADVELSQAWASMPLDMPPPQAESLAHSLARVRDRQGRLAAAAGETDAARSLDEEAEGLFRRALDGERRLLGEDHIDTVATRANFGVFLRHRGRLSEARVVLLEALASLDRRASGSPAARLMVQNNLGALDYVAGDQTAAEQRWRDVLAAEATNGDASACAEPAVAALSNLVRLLAGQGRFAAAEPLAAALVARTPTEDRNYPVHQSMLERIRQRAGSP